jgi:hypothetical protein
LAAQSAAPVINTLAFSLCLIVTELFATSQNDSYREPFMCYEADLTAVVYDPPAPELPHIAVLFGAEGAVIAVRPVESIDAGEAALASLIGHITAERQAAV